MKLIAISILCRSLISDKFARRPNGDAKGKHLSVLHSAAGVKGSCLASFPEDECSIDPGTNPKKHVRQIDPNGILHPNDPLVAFRVLVDVHLSIYAEEDHVEEEGEEIDTEEHPGLDEGEHEDDRKEGAEGTAEDSVDPLRVGVFARLPSLVEVLGVQTDNDEAHHELEESHDDARGAADAEIARQAGLDASLLGLHRPAAQKINHGENNLNHGQ